MERLFEVIGVLVVCLVALAGGVGAQCIADLDAGRWTGTLLVVLLAMGCLAVATGAMVLVERAKRVHRTSRDD